MLIGIDLGTTNSLAACFRNGKPELIPNRLGGYMTPSVVSVDEEGTVLIGETAREYGLVNPLRMARFFKRDMGTEKEFTLGDRKLRPEELSGLILRSLKEDAEQYLGEPCNEAIISVPAYFNDFQRKATKKAGELAGLQVLRIINEPTAAAIAYGVGSSDKDERCLVFDLGGGTFDVSILEFYKSIMEVHTIAGDNFLGGEDFTALLADRFLEKNAIAPESLDIRTRNRVLKAAEACKCSYSHTDSPVMSCIIDGEPVESRMPLSEFEKACEPLLERVRKPIERSLRDAGLKLDEIDRIVLVGGATRLPTVRRFVSKLFHIIPNLAVDPDTAVAMGAAIQCGMKLRDKEIREMVLTDVCPFTLGTEVTMDNGLFEEDGHYLPIIDRNTVIPVSRTQTVYTARDGQTRVNVKILQGESRNAKNNLLLGELSVPVLPGPKGSQAVEITYTYDINSLLECQVKVLSTGVVRTVIVQDGTGRLTEEEAKARFEELAYLKQNPRDDEENRLLLLRGERLYEEVIGGDREVINRALMDFERLLSQQDRTQIERGRKTLAKILDQIEMNL
ncbi:MAG: molecular chaperone HscC [Firmicutes bacterium]|nr:molecular chaperone HscC [Bacillota bacterium]